MNKIECAICYESFNGDTLCYTNCFHPFCKNCLHKWLETGNITCPTCRMNIDYYNYNDTINNIIRIPYTDTTNTTNTTNTPNTPNTSNTIIINKRKLLIFKFVYSVTVVLFLVSAVGNAHCKIYY